MYEVGCYYIDGENIDKLLVDSPDGLIRCNHNMNRANCCHPDVYALNSGNKSIEIKAPYPDGNNMPVHYSVPRYYILQCVIHMIVTNSMENWYASGGLTSVVLISCTVDHELWDVVWTKIKQFLDKARPVAKNWYKTISNDLGPQLDAYRENYTKLIAELPIVKCTEGNLMEPDKYSPYHVPMSNLQSDVTYNLDDIRDMMVPIMEQAMDIVKCGHHIVREESSEILAFIAVDSSRIPVKGIPCHLPIAYGLKGYSLPMNVMRSLIDDVRNKCVEHNVKVRCECYDGQFLQLVRYSEEGKPLTRLSFMQDFFKSMPLKNRKDCLNFIMQEVLPNNLELEWNIDANALTAWSTYCSEQKKSKGRSRRSNRDLLQSSDVTNLLRGSQLGRRLASRSIPSADGSGPAQEDSGDEDDSKDEIIFNDSDFNSESDYFSSDYIDSEDDMEMELQDLIRDTQSTGEVPSSTFLQEVLEALRAINKGSINWNIVDVDELVNDYLQKPDSCLKMTHDHLNAISNLLLVHTGVKVFNVSDNKATKINKLLENLGTASSRLVPTLNVRRKPVSRLLDLCKKVFLQVYPQDYLQLVLMKVIYEDSMMKWESDSSIPLNLQISQGQSAPFTHCSYSYPGMSQQRKQPEHRAIDPGHTLANMRSQISRHGYTFCKTAAFKRVSESNHAVLPKSILEDKLDRQSIRIAKRFFSKEVEDELTKNNDHSEAKFVGLVRNWYEACDERGIDVYTRLRNLEKFYRYMHSKVEWETFPPPGRYIQGMPIQTYESIMQGISTRMQIFALSPTPVNQRSISTLSIESFFSELTNMEFSGLGCPKAIDIPRLISHVTELNNIRHELDRGFSFNTTNRAAYPYHTLEKPQDPNLTVFDLPRHRKKCKDQTLLALPKAITRGTLPIREHHRKNESKVLLHKRAGIPDAFNPMDPS